MKKFKVIAILLATVLLLVAAVGCSSGSSEQASNGDGQQEITFPEKSIDMTILFGAGAGADVIGRTLADLAAEELGQPIVCNNRVGGGGAVGYQYVLNTDPDGYNIVWNSTSVSVAYHQGNMDQPYSAFRGVANITQEATALAIRADDDRWSNMEEFIAYAKEHPGEVTVANSGIGSFNHLMAAAIGNAADIELKHIPMDAKQSTTALLGGKVDAIVNMAFDIVQQQEAGTMKALVVVAENRLEKLPDVPTMKELGYDLDLMMYRGIAVPKDTPDEVVEILEDAFVKAGQSEEFKEFAEKYGAVVNVKGAEEFDQMMADNDAVVADIMESIGIKKQ